MPFSTSPQHTPTRLPRRAAPGCRLSYTDSEQEFLGLVPREKVPDVCAVLFDWYNADHLNGEAGCNGSTEKMGVFIHRMGYAAVLATFKGDARTAELLEKRNPAVGFDPYVENALVSQ